MSFCFSKVAKSKQHDRNEFVTLGIVRIGSRNESETEELLRNETETFWRNVTVSLRIVPAVGVQPLLVDYGKKYNTILRKKREEQQAAKSFELKNRRNRNHDFRCPICDQAMHRTRMLGHLAQCRNRAVVGD